LCGALSPPQPNWTALGRRSAPGCPRSTLFRPRRNTSKSALGRRLSISRSPITKRFANLDEQATEKRGDRGLNPASTEFSRREGVKPANGPPPTGGAGPRYQSFQALSGHGSFCARRFCTFFLHIGFRLEIRKRLNHTGGSHDQLVGGPRSPPIPPAT
jgi:hypothetical protein